MHVCELGFQHMTGANIANSAMKQEGREDEGEGRGRSSECISHSIALQHTGTLLDCMGLRGFRYTYITVTRTSYAAVRSLNSS
jgi:hypothetical protein